LYLTYEINWIQEDQEKNVSKTWKRSVWTNNVGSNFCASVVFWTFWHFCIIIDFAIGVKNCSLLLSDYKKIIHYWYKSNNFQKQDENNEDEFFLHFVHEMYYPYLRTYCSVVSHFGTLYEYNPKSVNWTDMCVRRCFNPYCVWRRRRFPFRIKSTF
jgi:hypothetical protein